MKMKDQRKTEIKVGITVVVGILVFIWILGWAKNFSFTSNERKLEVKFNNVAGLEVGDNATVNGVRKGYVESMKVSGEGVIVTLALDNDVQLNSDATFAVSMLDLMGGKKVKITPGTSSVPLDFSKVQAGIFYADIPTVMSMVGSIKDDLSGTLKELQTTLSAINNYLTDSKLNNNVKKSMDNLAEISGKLNMMIDENRMNIKKLTDNGAELTDQAKQFIKDNKTEMTSSVKEILTVLKGTDSLLAKINRLSDETVKRQNNLGKIIYDDSLYTNLSQSVKQINELTKMMIKQLNEEGIKVDAHVKFF